MEDLYFLSHPAPSPAPPSVTGAGTAAPPQSALIAHNLAIVLAALTCAILCALGLNSTMHCVVRCTRQAITDPADWAASRRLNSGLRQEDVLALPITVCALPAAGESSFAEFQMPAAAVCPICLSELAGGDRMRALPACGHRFHAVCIDTWLLLHRSCPTCRRRLSSPAEPKSLEIV